MRIPEIRETLLCSLTKVVAPRSTSQNTSNRNVPHAPANTNVIQDKQEMLIDAPQQPPNFVEMVQTLSENSNQEDLMPKEILGDMNIPRRDFDKRAPTDFTEERTCPKKTRRKEPRCQ